ncbi:MAG: alpha/beta hydrolase family protein [Chloroflexota bacterium]
MISPTATTPAEDAVDRGAFRLEPDWFARYYAEHPPLLRFQATTRAEWDAWRDSLRRRLWDLLGTFQEEARVPLNARLIEVQDEEVYRREKLLYDTAPGITAAAYLLIPKGVPLHRPAVLCPPGHGIGKEAVAQKGTTQDYGVRFAEAGFVTLAPEHVGFGERQQFDRGDPQKGYRLTNLKLQLLGMSVIGLRLWDLQRGLDLLQARPEVIPDRIGCAGLSLGGEMTLYLAALDDRVRAAVISGFLNTFRQTFFQVEHCNCGYVPGILKYAEMGDVAALIAPSPLLVEAGKRDTGFPLTGALEGYGIARRAYELLGMPEHCDIEVFDGGHAFSGRKAIPWMQRWLSEGGR